MRNNGVIPMIIGHLLQMVPFKMLEFSEHLSSFWGYVLEKTPQPLLFSILVLIREV